MGAAIAWITSTRTVNAQQLCRQMGRACRAETMAKTALWTREVNPSSRTSPTRWERAPTTLGYEPPTDREVWGELDDGSAAIVPGNEGRTVTLGFFMDTLSPEDGVTFYKNLIKLVLLHGLD